MSGPMTREEMLAQTEIALRMAKGIDAALSLPDNVDLKALAGAMRGLVKRLEGTHVALTLSSPCACGDAKVLAVGLATPTNLKRYLADELTVLYVYSEAAQDDEMYVLVMGKPNEQG